MRAPLRRAAATVAAVATLTLSVGCSGDGSPGGDADQAPAPSTAPATVEEVPALDIDGLILPAPLATDFSTSGWILDPPTIDENGNTLFTGFYQDSTALTDPDADTNPDAALDAVGDTVAYLELRYRPDDTLQVTLDSLSDGTDGELIEPAGVAAVFSTGSKGHHTLLLDTPDEFYLQADLYDVPRIKDAATYLGSLQPYTAQEWGSYLAYLEEMNAAAGGPVTTP